MTFPISVVTIRPSSSFFRRKIRAASRSSSPRRGASVFREALPPGGWPDPSGATTEGAPRLDVEGLVAHHPCGPGADAKVARGREQHAGPRFPTGAVRKDVMRTVVHRRNPHAFPPEGCEHRLVDARKLSLGDELPSGRVLVGDDHQPPARILEQAHPRDGTREELELRRG